MIARLFTLPLRMLVVAAALPIPSALGATPIVGGPMPAYEKVSEIRIALAPSVPSIRTKSEPAAQIVEH